VYNVFKRPMFKRGGTAQGSGIMSTVEPKPVPRVMARMGFPTMGLSQAPINPVTGMTAYEEMLSNRQISTPTPRGSIEDQFTIGMDEYVPNIEYEKIPKEQMSKFRQNLPEFMQQRRKTTALDKKGIETLKNVPLYDEADDTSEAATVLPGETAMDAVFKRAEEKAKERKTKEIKTDIDDKVPPKPEKTFDNIYQEEFDKLEKVVGKDDDTKGLLALAIGEALSTPGTIADKSKVLNKYLFKIAGERKSDRREIAKLAYSATKQIEAAKIAAGKEGYSEKLANEIRQYQGTINDPNASQQAKDFARQQIGIIGKTMKVINPPKEGLTSVESNMLTNFGKTVDRLARIQDKNSDKYKRDLQEYLTQRQTLLTFLPSAASVIAEQDKRLGLAKGGRVGFAEGSSPMQQVMPEKTIPTVGQGQTPTAEVDSLSFEQIRSRLPKEITDDVVTLLANSNAALQDFAYIRTQGDVNKFNEKYGVSLVLPATA
jgi:hypothetical protein